ncbi:hypothetical protein [Vibrio parahaemolyticus]|uniref:hypothetical protein n=1 Tax=Vibrio parahaemolyticus TaxID=670 RepID=UPI0005F13BBB|nr:hypothetical protein [Vibrio parahaemolyticus]
MRILLLLLVSCTAIASPESKTTIANSEPQIFSNIEPSDRPIVITLNSNNGGTKEKSEVKSLFSTSDVIAIVAAFVSSFSIYYSRQIDLRNRKASIHDGYWMREVIYPTFMQSLIEFVRDAPKHYRDAGGDYELFFDCYALDALNQIRDNTSFLNSIDKELPEKAEQLVDEFEEKLQSITDSSELKEVLSKGSASLVDLLKSVQETV